MTSITIVASIVASRYEYWLNVKSGVIRDPNAPYPPVITTATPPPKLLIETDSCGKTKGCYRNPAGCKEPACDAIVTWHIRGDKVEFELAAATTGWVAVGFSSDKKMGHDDVIECVWNGTRKLLHQSPVEVRLSQNGGGKSNQMLENRYAGLTHMVGTVSQHRVRCKFMRDRYIPGYKNLVNLDDDHYILLAKGKVDNNGMKKMHVLEPGKQPYVSKSMVSMKDIVDISGTARYPLAKIHGILMLIGWMMCASTALIMAKYYKPMWPNSLLCNEKVWFAVHRGCMSVTFFCTILGFILIFIHAGGYSQMPNLPDKAHPILGIITTIFCILNPLLAMCRCNEKSRNRPIFNWLHWFVGLVATVLATPTMFIGLNLAKAHVPWWTTWVMVAFMLFHLIIELLLEIHGCINGRKQKKREEEFMLRKKHDPRGELFGREPEPVGHHFKKRIITVYLFVVIILGLVMVISVAAG
ncbi:putative ferric-chelate reductase 1 [Lamellibrachia satsuma]|nr:putative ferric-chelate reductase 1 [Lamellibrachia satsuma]